MKHVKLQMAVRDLDQPNGDGLIRKSNNTSSLLKIIYETRKKKKTTFLWCNKHQQLNFWNGKTPIYAMPIADLNRDSCIDIILTYIYAVDYAIET
ncbi:hypothetical protein PanWU01x14_329340 [Parasponia andersonii]|uniref:Uncharacterized protein n=1 Tax=Parasponia andersonii TaxID=3476 RepID=A0A2P5AIC5_PARAD|nr:hypothetical protein PanWU01x14_329340 [Parasponia andersonii]